MVRTPMIEPIKNTSNIKDERSIVILLKNGSLAAFLMYTSESLISPARTWGKEKNDNNINKIRIN